MVVKVKKEDCTACGACAEICPVEAITIEEKAKVNPDICIDCGTCIGECPAKALEL
ncbi:MAG: 4Fe-4S binding protein [Candidatus Thermoplasmatota archaeon]